MKFAFFRRFFKNNDAVFEQIIRKHAQLLAEAAKRLDELFGNLPQRDGNLDRIISLEKEADRLVKDVFFLLDQTFIVSRMEKTDIEKFISTLDDTIDLIKKVARLARIKDSLVPRKEANEICHIIVEMTGMLNEAINAFYEGQLTRIKDYTDRIKKLEEQADSLTIEANQQLFKENPEVNLMLLWRDLLKSLEKTTDTCEDVMDIISSVARREL
ncbi:MAG: DUF47 family protein [Thermodesulfobacteriota bacterium]